MEKVVIMLHFVVIPVLFVVNIGEFVVIQDKIVVINLPTSTNNRNCEKSISKTGIILRKSHPHSAIKQDSSRFTQNS